MGHPKKILSPLSSVSLLIFACLALCGTSLNAQIDTLRQDSIQEITITDLRAQANTPVAFSNYTKQDIAKNNVGIDLPVLLDQMPSLVSTSDAGAGVGYTALRIRGSDGTRINVTLNGIPLNDPESQSVFWVNTPDFASSADNIQVQRGAGTSTNGAGSFGGSVNIITTKPEAKSFVLLGGSIGSFGTYRGKVQAATGLIPMLKGHVFAEGRLSYIQSQGYRDRSASDLKSYYLDAGYISAKTSLKFVNFAGQEITGQAWNGVPLGRITGDRQSMLDHAANSGFSPAQTQALLNGDRRFNEYLYPNQVDNYRQYHYQLHWSQVLTDKLTFNLSGHYTSGGGYYEQFQDTLAPFDGTSLSDYSLPNVIQGTDTFRNANIVRRRWLDNHFYGAVWSIKYEPSSKVDLTLGGAWNLFENHHFGEVVSASRVTDLPSRHRYYDGRAEKHDLNAYAKLNWRPIEKLNLFADLQYRQVIYQFAGLDTRGNPSTERVSLPFFNPKLGLSYAFAKDITAYASWSVAQREPNRNDFTESSPNSRPRPERMDDFELGARLSQKRFSAELNGYYMRYTDELALTGRLNDVGYATRVNVPRSSRLGIEASASGQVWRGLTLMGNVTLSQNKIDSFTQYVDTYDASYNYSKTAISYQNTDLAFAPNVIAGAEVAYNFFHGNARGNSLVLAYTHKHVGQQFIDNTSDARRSLDAYNVGDVRLQLSLKKLGRLKEVTLNAQCRNVWDAQYSSNAWTYWYFTNNTQYTEVNGYFPQAGRNLWLGLEVKF